MAKFNDERKSRLSIWNENLCLRNPFVAIWSVLDRDNILWITGEHYSREKSLAYHL